MTELQALVYVSTATHLLTQTEIDYLLDHAQARNSQESITGLLLYNDGNFLQYLEGPPAQLSKIYEIIKADPLHKGIIELLREPISMRELPECYMAFCSADSNILSQPTEVNTRLSQWLDPSDCPMSMARMLITKLWPLNKRPICW